MTHPIEQIIRVNLFLFFAVLALAALATGISACLKGGVIQKRLNVSRVLLAIMSVGFACAAAFALLSALDVR